MDAVIPGSALEQGEADKPRPRVILLRGVTGSRKTQKIIEKLGQLHRDRLAEQQPGFVVGFTPRHDLNNDVARRWQHDTGLVAATVMGRLSKDPADAKPGKEVDPDWCKMTPLVKRVQELGFPVKATCCSYTDKDGGVIKCKYFDVCGNQMQYEIARNADLVLMPHASLVHQQDELDKPYSGFIDEDFLDGLIFELPNPKSNFKFRLGDLLVDSEPVEGAIEYDPNRSKFRQHRLRLYDFVQEQVRAGEFGGLQRKYFVETDDKGGEHPLINSAEARWIEFKLMPDIAFRPNLKGEKLRECEKRNAKALARRARHMFMAEFFKQLGDWLSRDDIEISGRCFVTCDEDGEVFIGVRGLRPICQQWLAPNLIVASATMPPLELLAYAFPDCDIIPDDQPDDEMVELPKSVRIVQVRNAPTPMYKTRRPLNQNALRRYAMERALEHHIQPKADGTPAILVGVQLDVEKAFNEMELKLPGHFAVRHFNAVSGLNDFRSVDLMISIGLTRVSPVDLEDQVAAITGRDPERLGEGERLKKVMGHIYLRSGDVVETTYYVHPDRLVEMWRKHKYIAAIIQMIGRSRLYNRDADSPLVIYVLCDEPIGVLVDEVLDWDSDELHPMALVEPINVDGFVVLAPEAMIKLWPSVFESKGEKQSKRTAERELQQLRDKDDKAAKRIQAILAGWCPFTLQKPGKRQKRRQGYYDPDRFHGVEELRGSLERALGPGLELKEG